jgi:hypothetical protein
LDAFKIVIASGYTVAEADFIQILHFIKITEVSNKDSLNQVRDFIKTAAFLLGFMDAKIDEIFKEAEIDEHYYRDIFEKDYKEED